MNRNTRSALIGCGALVASTIPALLLTSPAAATPAPTVTADANCQAMTITVLNNDGALPIGVRVREITGSGRVIQPKASTVYGSLVHGRYVIEWSYANGHSGATPVIHQLPPNCTPDTTTPPVDTTAPVTTPPPADSSVPPTPSSPPVASTEPAQPVPTGSGSVQPSRKGTLPATGSDWTLALIGSGMLAAGALSMFGVKRWAR
jgi:LPXTG-motif cell wall-anchored protein